MKQVALFILISVVSVIVFDIFLSSFLDKKIYNLKNNKIEIHIENKSRKQIDWLDVYDIDNIPYWDSQYRGPFMNYTKEKTKQCRIVGLGDSIIWGSGVDKNETYFHFLQKKWDKIELLNFGNPGSDILQQIVKYKKEGIDNNDLLIWHIWEDDMHMYKNIDGVLYDVGITLNEVGDISLFPIIPVQFNSFLIQYSYLYNSVLGIKNTVQKINIENRNYIINQFIENIEEYKKENKKILILFSPSLQDNSYKGNHWDREGYPWHYKEIENRLSQDKNIYFLYLDQFFQGMKVDEVRYDDCCHFNKKGHEVIAEKLYEYIRTNKLLDEICY